MARTYTLKARAEHRAQTRQKIVEAAVDLHGTVGPARTSLSMVAERAGVQRNTLYAHFPDERSLLMACSGLSFERSPPPDGAAWLAVGDPRARLRTALAAVYAWFGANAGMLGCVLRDAEHYPPVQEIAALRFGPVIAGWRAALGEGRSPEQQAMIGLALDFHAWRALVRDGGLTGDQAAEAMARAVESV